MKRLRYVSVICAFSFLVMSFSFTASALVIQDTLFNGSFTSYSAIADVTNAGWTISGFSLGGTTTKYLYNDAYSGSISAMYLNQSFGNEYVYSGKFSKKATGAGQYSYIVFNYKDATNYYFVRAEGATATATINLYKKINGTDYSLVTPVTNVNLGTFAENTFMITNNNGTISVSIRGNNIFTNISDVTEASTTVISGGSIGYKTVNTGGYFGEPVVKSIPQIVESRTPYFEDDFSNAATSALNWTIGTNFAITTDGYLAQTAYSEATSKYNNEVWNNNTVSLKIKVGDAQTTDYTSNYAYIDYNDLRLSIFSRLPANTNSLIRLGTKSGAVIKEVPLNFSINSVWNTVEIFYDASGYISIYVTVSGKKYALCEHYNAGVYTTSTLSFTSKNTPTYIDNVKIYNGDFVVLEDSVKDSIGNNIASLNNFKGQTVKVAVSAAENVKTSNTPFIVIAVVVDPSGNIKAVGTSAQQTASYGVSGKAEATIEVPTDISNGCTVKAFIWSDLVSLKPLSSKIDVSMLN